MKSKIKNVKGFANWNVEKHCRWFRRYCYRQYIRRVRIIEREIGGQIQAC